MRLPSRIALMCCVIHMTLPMVCGNGSANQDTVAKRRSARAVSHLKMYPGLEATLFASEPMIGSPTNLDVDHRGRVWVCDVMNYRGHGSNNLRPEGDRILILEDTDGDGVADLSKVYYQGRDIDAALGICVLGNQVIVTSAPNVLVFTDDDGDDKPDRKEYLFTKTGLIQNDHSTHSFVLGPDGKLYWNMGNWGLYVRDREGNLVRDRMGQPVFSRDATRYDPEFRDRRTPYHGGMVFRCNRDGSEFEVLGHNFRNNYEVTVDSFGTLWQSDNDDDGNFGCRINYVMEFGNFGYRDERTGASWWISRIGQNEETTKRHWHQNDPGVVPNFIITGAGSPTGMTVYEGRLLPEAFWDQVVHCDAGPGVVWAATAEPEGAGYTGSLVHILKEDKDKWVRPADVAVAPDGSLFVTDWYDPVVGWNRQLDVERGRIFRVAPKGHRYGIPEFDFDTPQGAVVALKSPNYAARSMAWHVLHQWQAKAEPALVELFRTGNLRHRARALWLLSKIRGRGTGHVQNAIRDHDADIRIVGLRAARQAGIDILPFVRELVVDTSRRVLRECAIALRHSEAPDAPGLWADLAMRHDGDDRWYLEALGIGADGRWDDYLDAWLQKVGFRRTRGDRDIIWRSRSKRTPPLLTEVIHSAEVDLEGTRRYLRAMDFQDESRKKTESLRRLAFDIPELDNPKSAFVAAEALIRLDTMNLDSKPGARERIEEVLKHIEGTETFAKLVQRYGLRQYYPGLMAVAVENKDNPIGIAAIQTLLSASADEVIEEVLKGQVVESAVAAVDVLGSSLDQRAYQFLSGAVVDGELTWRVREQALRALARTGGGVRVLIELAKANRFPEELRESAGVALTRSMHVRNRTEAGRFFPLQPMKNQQSLPQMTELLVHVGDPERGQAVFRSATCDKCHIVEEEGTDFGPNLSEIGGKLSKAGLYESILDPSGGISPSYKLYQFTLRGEEISGFIIDESNDTVTLRMEKGIVSEFKKSDLSDRYESPLSAMPSDLHQEMSREELVDLVEYLTTLK